MMNFLALEPKIDDKCGGKYSEPRGAGPLDQVETREDRLWLQKIREKTPAEVCRKKNTETSALRPTGRSREP